MEYMTINEISKLLDISVYTVKGRLIRRNIQPVEYRGVIGYYDSTVIEDLQKELPRGRHSPKWGTNSTSTEGLSILDMAQQSKLSKSTVTSRLKYYDIQPIARRQNTNFYDKSALEQIMIAPPYGERTKK